MTSDLDGAVWALYVAIYRRDWPPELQPSYRAIAKATSALFPDVSRRYRAAVRYARMRDSLLAANKAWREAHREERRRYRQDYEKRNRDRLRLVYREYGQRTREHKNTLKRERYAVRRNELAEQRRAYRTAHPEAVREQKRRYYAAHRDSINGRRRHPLVLVPIACPGCKELFMPGGNRAKWCPACRRDVNQRIWRESSRRRREIAKRLAGTVTVAA